MTSVTIHSKGIILDHCVFHIKKYSIVVHTFYFNYYFWRYGLLCPSNSYD